jgi:hypothetical protein
VAAAAAAETKTVAGRSRIVFLLAVATCASASVAAAADSWPKFRPNAADQALAKKSILHSTDFTPGSGWAAAPYDSSGSGSSGGGSGGDTPECNNAAFSSVGEISTGSAKSSFKAPGVQVWSEADVMKTVAMAKHDAKLATKGAVLKCLQAATKKNLPAGMHAVSVKRLAFPAVGDWSTAYRVIFDVSSNGKTVPVQLDLILVLNDRVEITLMQASPFAISNLAEAAEQRLVQQLVLNPLIS